MDFCKYHEGKLKTVWRWFIWFYLKPQQIWCLWVTRFLRYPGRLSPILRLIDGSVCKTADYCRIFRILLENGNEIFWLQSEIRDNWMTRNVFWAEGYFSILLHRLQQVFTDIVLYWESVRGLNISFDSPGTFENFLAIDKDFGHFSSV